jgi:hypothetical protein
MLPDAFESRSARLSDRANSAMLALAVQAGFLAVLLVSFEGTAPQQESVQETILLLHTTQRSAPATIDARVPKRQPQRMPFTVVPQVARPTSSAPITTVPPSSLSGFGMSLFGCAPEHYADLPPDERAHCPKPGEGMGVNQPPDLMGHPSHVKDEARWEAELARNKSAAWLPCTVAIHTPLGSAPGFNLACVDTMVGQGTLTNPHDWPIYETKKYPAETLYKVQQAYDAWNSDHPMARSNR